MVPFNRPYIGDFEYTHIKEALSGRLCGDGSYTKKAIELFKEKTGIAGIILTTSCTHALELAALLCDIRQGDEVIMPSYTFSSTANAFLLRGAKIVFCEIRNDTMNIDERLIAALVTRRTKAIVPVHYAGVACEMDIIMDLARQYGLFVVEDSAQAVGSYYNGVPCGALADVGCYSFHATKNYSMGEGGGIYIKSETMRRRAEVIREKGTDRSSFLRGYVDKYTWQQPGSSYLPSDILAALLYAQLTCFDEIMQRRMAVWDIYNSNLTHMLERGWQLPSIPMKCLHNAHMYYMIAPSAYERDKLINLAKEFDIQVVSHYEPLHTSPMGLSMGYTANDLPITIDYAARLVRLPLWAGMVESDISKVIEVTLKA